MKLWERPDVQEIGLLHSLGCDDLLLVSANLWFAVQDREQAILTAIWIPSIFGFGIYFKLAALMGRKR